MFATTILEYPEFLAVALLAVLFLRSSSHEQEASPSMLRTAGISLFALLPQRYRQWVANTHNFASYRSNSAIAEFAAKKVVWSACGLLTAFAVPAYVGVLLAAILFFVPDVLLLAAAKKRQQEIRDALPQALDLMVLCVDAGLGLDATIQRISADQSSVSKALNEELANLGRDILLGMDRARAYAELYRRTGVDELKMLGSALNQSTKMGLSIARILRAQSEFLRTRQSQKAEEKASKLPVWISFPLWFCIMPALLFVIMGPSLISFLQHIGNVKPEWFN